MNNEPSNGNNTWNIKTLPVYLNVLTAFKSWTLDQLTDVSAACTAAEGGTDALLVRDMILICEKKTVVIS